jgi:hypothetical protein
MPVQGDVKQAQHTAIRQVLKPLTFLRHQAMLRQKLGV